MRTFDVAIVGAGITGLTIATYLEQAGVSCILLEKAARAGGQVRTLKDKGYTFEIGPNTGTISEPEVAELFDLAAQTTRAAELQVASSEAKSRWIWHRKKFYALPSGPVSGMLTPLVTLRDKVRLLGEPWRAKGTDELETVGEIAARRLGKSYVRNAVDPFIGGIYAGDPYQLVTKYALPRLWNLEQNYGSFIRGALAKSKIPKSEREKRATKEVFSAVGGLQALTDALAGDLAARGTLQLNVQDLRAQYLKGSVNTDDTTNAASADSYPWELNFQVGTGPESSAAYSSTQVQTLHAKYLITTVRADLLPALLADLGTSNTQSTTRQNIEKIAQLRYAPVTEVVLGFNHLPDVQRNAFGGLIPSAENREVLGILFPSSCFTGRTPHADSALFTVFMGGIRQGEKIAALTDDEVKALAQREVKDMLKIPAGTEPDLVYMHRYPKAIAQYDDSTPARLEAISQLEAQYSGLYLAGAIRDGVGLANRITQGTKIAKEIISKEKLPH